MPGDEESMNDEAIWEALPVSSYVLAEWHGSPRGECLSQINSMGLLAYPNMAKIPAFTYP